MADLTRDEAMVLVLTAAGGMTYREAAAEMNCAERDILLIIRRALYRVGELYESEPNLFDRPVFD